MIDHDNIPTPRTGDPITHIQNQPWEQYLSWQFPATVGHLPLTEWIKARVSDSNILNAVVNRCETQSNAIEQLVNENAKLRVHLDRFKTGSSDPWFPAPVQSEPSQVGWKEELLACEAISGAHGFGDVIERRFACTVERNLKSELAAAQATIAEQKIALETAISQRDSFLRQLRNADEDKDHLHTENVALRDRVSTLPRNDLPTAR